MSDERKRLEDGRSELGEEFGRAQGHEDRELGPAFADAHRGDTPTVGDEFADTGYADRHGLAESFADPNAQDDQRLGKAFAQANSSGKKKKSDEEQSKKKPTNFRLLLLLAAAVAVVFALVFLLGFLPRHRRNKQIDEKAQQEQGAAPVLTVEAVKRAGSGGGLVVPGTTTPLTEAYLYARANGYLKLRLVDIGDHVHKGQLLAVIDSPDLDRQVDQAREQLRQADAQLVQQQTQLALTRITVERYRVLVAKGAVSRQEGDQQETNYGAQEANVAAAARNVEAFKANLQRVIALQGYERVTAPFEGIVTARNVDVGSLISAQGSAGGDTGQAQQSGTSGLAMSNTGGVSGSPSSSATPSNAGGQGGPLFTISQVNRLRVLVSVPEGYAGAVRTGLAATLHVQEFPDAAFHGTVTRTAGSIDQNTRTLLTEVQVDNRDGRLLNGMYAVVTFAPTGGAQPLVVPGDAIAVRQDRNVVAVVHDGMVHIQPVNVGRDYGPVVEVLGGLNEGDLIASSFTDEVRDNGKVQAKMGNSPGAQHGAQGAPNQNQLPGGSTQYGNQAITDANMLGQSAKQQQSGGGQKQTGGGGGEQKSGGGNGGGKP